MASSPTSFITAARSPMPWVFTAKPNRASAETLSPFGHGDLAHVVAEAHEPAALPIGPRAGHAHPARDGRLRGRVAPVADDHLAPQPQPRVQEPRLPVAVRRLVKVHEVHVDVGPGQVAVELRVQVQERLGQRRQAADPHLGRREGVHPQDQPGAGGGRVGLQQEGADFLGPGQDGLAHQGQRQGARRTEFRDDLLRIGGDLPERLLAVEVLAAGDVPDFVGVGGFS